MEMKMWREMTEFDGNETVDEELETKALIQRVLAISTQVLLFFLVYGFAATVHYKSFRESLKSKGLFLALGLQFIVMPIVGFAFVTLVPGLEVFEVLMLTIITTSPGGSYSNLYNSLFNGDLSLSVAITTVSMVVSLFALPLNLLLYVNVLLPNVIDELDEQNSASLIDWCALGQTIGILIAGVAAGVFTNYKAPHLSSPLNKAANVAGLLMIVIALFASNSEAPITSKKPQVYIVTLLPSGIALAGTIIIAWLMKIPKPSIFAVAIEVCIQNSSISTSFALTAFSTEIAAAAIAIPVLYAIGNVIFATMFAFIALRAGWTHTPKGTPWYWALLGNYQPNPDELNPSEPKLRDDSSGLDDIDLPREVEL